MQPAREKIHRLKPISVNHNASNIQNDDGHCVCHLLWQSEFESRWVYHFYSENCLKWTKINEKRPGKKAQPKRELFLISRSKSEGHLNAERRKRRVQWFSVLDETVRWRWHSLLSSECFELLGRADSGASSHACHRCRCCRRRNRVVQQPFSFFLWLALKSGKWQALQVFKVRRKRRNVEPRDVADAA